jgi:hypothetical protein
LSAATPVDRVTELLVGAGYRLINKPFQLAGLTFDFSAAFVGTKPSPDFIVVADTAFDHETLILKKLEGIARAMDALGSRRPLTAVLAGPKPTTSVLDAMSKVCRVLPIGVVVDVSADTALRNWLAVLLPLELPEPSGTLADSIEEISANMADLAPELADLPKLASGGSAAVEQRLHEIIAACLEIDEADSEQ